MTRSLETLATFVIGGAAGGMFGYIALDLAYALGRASCG